MTSLIGALGPSDDIELRQPALLLPDRYLDPWTKAASTITRAKITKKKWDPEFVAELNGLKGRASSSCGSIPAPNTGWRRSGSGPGCPS